MSEDSKLCIAKLFCNSLKVDLLGAVGSFFSFDRYASLYKLVLRAEVLVSEALLH